jgi:hypothetical protein
VTYKTIRYSDHADRARRAESISRSDVRRLIIAGEVVPSDGTGYHFRRGVTVDGRPLEVIYREGPAGIISINVYIVHTG